MKKELRFKDGKFRMLFIGDLQESDQFDPRTFAGVGGMLDSCRPDLVFLTGDNVDGTRVIGEEQFRRALHAVAEPMESRGIPWAHVFGNHDYDVKEIEPRVMQAIYEEYPCCVSSHSDGISGITNFVLPILSERSDAVAYAVWGLDVGGNTFEPMSSEIMSGEAGKRGLIRPSVARVQGAWGTVRFDQQMWYYNRSLELEREAGRPVHGLIATHVAPWEFDYMRCAPEETLTEGTTGENYGLGLFNSGLFATVYDRGDVRCICAGHTHENTCHGQLAGIHMCNVGCAGFSCYGIDGIRGGRLIEIAESDTREISTRMLRSLDWCGE